LVFSLSDALLGLAPGCLWLWYFWRKDAWEPEPKLALVRVFVLGCVAGWVVSWLRPRLEQLLPAEEGLALELADAFLVTALGEELFKLVALALGALWHRQWNEPMDGIVYGAAAALGFASFENAVYVATSTESSLILVRAFTANLAHVAFTAGMAFTIGLGWLRGRALLFGFAGLVVAVAFHGLYDLFLFSIPEWNLLSLLGVLPVALAILGLKVRYSHERSPFREPAVAFRAADDVDVADVAGEPRDAA
jgi:RsiW-degrading membrane proteinase PrsW (M82 family)